MKRFRIIKDRRPLVKPRGAAHNPLDKPPRHADHGGAWRGRASSVPGKRLGGIDPEMSDGWMPAPAAVWAVIPLAVAAGAIWLWLRGRAALEELSGAAALLAQGKPVRPLAPRFGGLSEDLVERFNASAAALEARIARLEEDRRQLDAVLSGMAEGVLAVDARQRLVFANPAAQRLFQLERPAVGRLIAELIRNPRIQIAVEATLAGGGTYRNEISLPGPDPLASTQDRILSVHGTPLPGAPPSGAVLVFHDVTELRRLERMRQDFVANASHELKTPLASIKVNTETLLDWGLNDPAVNVELLRQIDDQADRLHALIQDMLSLARLESGEAPFRAESMVLGPVVADCVAAQRPRAAAKGLTFRAEVDRLDGSVRVLATEEAIRQVLNNLIDNAIKYTPEGGSIRLSTHVGEDRVSIDVADTGVGIPREDLPRVFERFYRVDKARSRAMGGTGLGLAIVKHLVQSLGGEVRVESQLGVGSIFRVRIPRSTDQPS